MCRYLYIAYLAFYHIKFLDKYYANIIKEIGINKNISACQSLGMIFATINNNLFTG